MTSSMLDAIVKRFDKPDEIRQFPKGRFELVTIAGRTFGRATYEPGWKWSVHVGPRSAPLDARSNTSGSFSAARVRLRSMMAASLSCALERFSTYLLRRMTVGSLGMSRMYRSTCLVPITMHAES